MANKIVQKRTTLVQKLAYILRPFVVYMIVKTVTMLVFAIAIPALPVPGIDTWAAQNSRFLSAVVNAVASIVAVAFLLNDFLIEADTTGEVDIDKNVFWQYVSFMKSGFLGAGSKKKVQKLLICAVSGVAASFVLNKLIGFLIVFSKKYKTVEEIQYSVPVWLGLVLYGIISPIVEEMVFRGVVYNRIKKFFGVFKAVVFSALLFGFFHGNLPQFLYGTIMGILMAICYEYAECFAAPVLVHMAANVFVFLVSV